MNAGPHARAHVYRVGELHTPPPARGPCSVVFLIDDGGVAPAGPAVFGRAIREWVHRRAELVLICSIPMPIAPMLALALRHAGCGFDCAVIADPRPAAEGVVGGDERRGDAADRVRGCQC